MLSRGSKLAMSPRRTGMITESLQGGLRKFEAVFDQRVLDSLARASMPPPGEMRDLMNRVAALESAVQKMARARGKK